MNLCLNLYSQRVEFELQELKNKEKNHCKINESLIQILGNVEETQLNVRKK